MARIGILKTESFLLQLGWIASSKNGREISTSLHYKVLYSIIHIEKLGKKYTSLGLQWQAYSISLLLSNSRSDPY